MSGARILAPSYFALGVRAFTSGLVNFMPHTTLRILNLLRDRRMEQTAQVIEAETRALFRLRAKRPGNTTVVIKEAMNLCGLKAGPAHPPLAALPVEDRDELRAIVDRLGITKAAGARS